MADTQSGRSSQLAERVSELALSYGRTVATAESLTGGRISCLLAAAPHSSQWFRGSIVAYSRDVKHALLGVAPGPVVSDDSARAMAANTAELLAADTVAAVTGVGGPEGQDGHEPGTVWFALYDRGLVRSEKSFFAGDPGDIVEQTAIYALELLTHCLDTA